MKWGFFGLAMTLPQVLAGRQLATADRPVGDARGCAELVDRLGFCYAFTSGMGDVPALFSHLDTSDGGQRWDWVWAWKDQLSLAGQV